MASIRSAIVLSLYHGAVDGMTDAADAHKATSAEVMSAALTFTKEAARAILSLSQPDEREFNREQVLIGLDQIKQSIAQ